MKMDVEFVYNAAEKKFYIVQARPIPQGDRGQLKPSSFPPDVIAKIKQNHDVRIVKATIISPADQAVKVIKDKSELLSCDHLGDALEFYLAQEHSPIKAVVVTYLAPSTSHEAAQFNAKAIPVFQVDDRSQLEKWLEQPGVVLFAAPQRNHIVDWTKKVITRDKIEESLYKEGILCYGRFRSPLPPQVTLLKSMYSEKEVNERFKKSFFSSSNVVPFDGQRPYTHLNDLLELIEGAKPGTVNETAFNALQAFEFALYRLSRLKLKDTLVRHAMIYSANVKMYLQDYSHISNLHDAETAREEQRVTRDPQSSINAQKLILRIQQKSDELADKSTLLNRQAKNIALKIEQLIKNKPNNAVSSFFNKKRVFRSTCTQIRPFSKSVASPVSYQWSVKILDRAPF